ncbi:Early nodulin-like protein 1 [Rhynchospora pubera]|uniref:Early nodulin-like protein 1 n=1 Tax=Rhynchospora pubera TaxID=906938 RepID=A0AAV8GFF1_9POAL|nr:Early nodulin-like protein 1 [Rhynchospora pubera]
MERMVKILFQVVALVAIAELAMSEKTCSICTVGAPGGSWNLQTNLTHWSESNIFYPGDVLIFSYNSSQHNVLEVTKSDFDSCTATNPIAAHTDGSGVINLSAVGTRYFICGFTGHCAAGQKVQINVVASPTGGSFSNSGIVSVTAGAGLVAGLAAILAF